MSNDYLYMHCQSCSHNNEIDSNICETCELQGPTNYKERAGEWE